MRIEEKMLILPALYIIKRMGTATTSDLIEDLTAAFNPSGEDAQILAGRKDTKFSQKVRNLVSHRATNGMAEYTSFEQGVYSLTEAGETQLAAHLPEMDYFFSQKFEYGDTLAVADKISSGEKVVVYEEELAVSEGKVGVKISKARKRSKALRDAALAYYTEDGQIRCSVCGFCYEEVYGEWGRGYMEIHHERPICQYDEAGQEQFVADAVKNVKPLCANCHRMIHRDPKRPLTIAELKEMREKHVFAE